ncbi:hypothetical protein KC960_03425 [Candidatus Saccharibacteria bacterium]|nr:hypothetical protein [Candidatus Saccharibacteria bacterium]MCA9346514.1 hypothetical protein [Candidatus Saccharibacteria bacterium]
MDEQQVRKDIEMVVNYLKIHQPENATPEYAAAMLDFLQTNLHDLAQNDPEQLLNLYESFKADKEKEHRSKN